MSLHSIDKIVNTIISTGSIPNGLIFYGEECEFLFHFSIDFARKVNCTCNALDKVYNKCSSKPSIRTCNLCTCKSAMNTCDNCALFFSFQHPDIKFIFPILHLDVDDCCDNYIEEFKAFFMNEKSTYSLEMWTDFLTKQGKQMSILNNDVETIKNFASLPAILGKYKIIVICFPETMNKSATNMLLKMMEEPTFNTTLFLFLTNDMLSLLPTIRSRCLSIFVPNNIGPLSSNTVWNLKKKDVYLDNVMMWLKYCATREYEKINIINEKITSLGKESVRIFLLMFLKILNDLLYIKFNISQLETLESADDNIKSISHSLVFNDIVNMFKKVNREVLNINRNLNLKIMMFDLSLFISGCLNPTNN